MLIDVNYKGFQELMNKHFPEHPVTEAEAAEAFHNLADFVELLMEISESLSRDSKGSRH